MASTYQLFLNGAPAEEDLYTDLPGAIQLRLPVSRSDDGDLTYVNDGRLGPLANLAVVATVEGAAPECIFDGYVLANRLHVETGTTNASLEVWGQDASWLMNLEEKVKEWVDVTDAAVAAAVFGEYGITPAPENQQDDSPAHTEAGHTLMQRASDIQFLRTLARRSGKLCRVVCKDAPGTRTGYFAGPRLDGEPAVTLSLNDPEGWSVSALDFAWDVSRPTVVTARQALFTDAAEDGVGGTTDDSGLPPLDERGLAAFAGKPMTVLLTAPV